MIHAYDKIYLDKARVALGRMLDFAVHGLKIDLHSFWIKFLDSEICTRFEIGDSSLLAGMSGIEMAFEVAAVKSTRTYPSYSSIERSEEYWLGWALAYYQWDTGLKFKDIFDADDVLKIKTLYSPYHEMDIRHFCDKMNELYIGTHTESNLKKYRKNAGLSQSELSALSEIPLRTIQQYEQKRKNINNANVEYVIRLAKVLRCSPEDLIERVNS
jgi:DNA-binding transcriptional regulator YiaG